MKLLLLSALGCAGVAAVINLGMLLFEHADRTHMVYHAVLLGVNLWCVWSLRTTHRWYNEV